MCNTSWFHFGKRHYGSLNVILGLSLKLSNLIPINFFELKDVEFTFRILIIPGIAQCSRSLLWIFIPCTMYQFRKDYAHVYGSILHSVSSSYCHIRRDRREIRSLNFRYSNIGSFAMKAPWKLHEWCQILQLRNLRISEKWGVNSSIQISARKMEYSSVCWKMTVGWILCQFYTKWAIESAEMSTIFSWEMLYCNSL